MGMSAKNNRTPKKVLKPILNDTVAQDKATQNKLKVVESGSSRPKPAELDQDAGAGFNPDHTIPQP